MEQLKKTAPNYLIYIGLILIGFCLFLYLDYINPSIAFDDAYSMRMSQRSFADILHITAQDVHPPLYYWLLKSHSSIFGFSMHVQRIFSNIGILATMLLAMFAIRKRFGDRTAITFLLLLIIFPVTQFLASEIRMYSWAMFFTLATAIFAYDSYKKGCSIDYLKMAFWALCAAYTHYFALMSVGWVFLFLFIFLWKEKRINRYYFIAIGLFIIIYTPWVSHLFFQIKQVNNDYWIKPLSLNDIYYHLYYFYSIKKDWLPFGNTASYALMTSTAIIILTQALALCYTCVSFIRKRSKQDQLIIITFLLFIFPILSGFVISLLIRPISVPRYMLCSFGLLLISLALAYNNYIGTRKMKAFMILSTTLLLISSAVRYWGTTRLYSSQRQEVVELNHFIDKHSVTTQSFLGEHYAAGALSRINVLFPDKLCYILTYKQSLETFEPFSLKRTYPNQALPTNFILVQRNKEEGGQVAADFKKALCKSFHISDSIKVLDMELYIMNLRRNKHQKN